MRYIKYLLCATIFLGCDRDDDAKIDSYLNSIEFRLEDDTIVADGIQYGLIQLLFDKDFETSNEAKFIVDSKEVKEPIFAKFVNGKTIKVSEHKFQSLKSGAINVQAEIDNKGLISYYNGVLNFKKSFPESVEVQAVKRILKADSSLETINVNTIVKREQSAVSIDCNVETIAVDTLGQLVGEFIDYQNSPDKAGVVKNNFSMGFSSYIGPIYLVSSTRNNNNERIVDSLKIIVTKK